MPSAFAVAEILPWFSISTRLICSHSTRFTEGGFSLTGAEWSPDSRWNAATMSSASAGLLR